MSDTQKRLQKLADHLAFVEKKQAAFGEVIQKLKQEIRELQQQIAQEEGFVPTAANEEDKHSLIIPEHVPVASKPKARKKPLNKRTSSLFSGLSKAQLEQFIGGNLISKIGVLILVIGVAIGAKFAIDHELISPLTRIILGYLVGIGLFAFAYTLKEKYNAFSAVLLSGAMAILYFITFAAFSFYQLISQEIAFGLMLLFTIFTVLAALNYKQQFIALLGLVGAYAVPFLLSQNSGNIQFLFIYISIVNVGILVLSVFQYWRLLFYTAFFFTYAIVLTWLWGRYTPVHFQLTLVFASLYFLLFYASAIAYKLKYKQAFNWRDISLLSLNSFVYYGIGYVLLMEHEQGLHFLGLFTVFNALIHFVVAYLIHKQAKTDTSLFYFVAGLVLVFITMAAPVQLDGNWVTILWLAEAVLLFWLARYKALKVYEYMSYALMLLGFVSLLHDWSVGYRAYFSEPTDRLQPIFNIHFLTSIIAIAGFAAIFYLSQKIKSTYNNWVFGAFTYIIPSLLILITYASFYQEIASYFGQLRMLSEIKLRNSDAANEGVYYNYNLPALKTSWIFIYSFVFASALNFLNQYKIKDQILTIASLLISAFVIVLFLQDGLGALTSLSQNYYDENLTKFFNISNFNLTIRYLSFAALALLLYSCVKQAKTNLIELSLTKGIHLALHFVILCILSNELIHLFTLGDYTLNYNIGLSILWGLYALGLIVIGIWKHKQHLRIAAIVLFAITLVKLFLYDISHLSTIAKTIVFVALGILLLAISFLYNKYQNTITDEQKTN